MSKTNNAFAEWGSFGHSLLEQYYKGELEFFELSQKYENEYKDNVKLRFPPNRYVDLNEKYYYCGKEYFDNFEGDFDDCKVLGVEQKLNVKIDKYDFTGYIDLILKNKDGIIVVDHKSKSGFKTKKEKAEYLRQLYLYSIYIHEKYGEYPQKLIFNMFRANKKEEEIFNIKDFKNAKEWAVGTIGSIYKDKEFNVNSNDFFCNYLCSVCTHCPCSDRYINYQ